MELLGVESQSIEYVFKGYGASVAKSLYRHHVDIGCAYGGPLRVLYKVGDAIIDGAQLDQNGVKLFDAITMSNNFLENHRDLAKKFMHIVNQQNKEYLDDPNAMKKGLSDTSNLKIVITHRLLRLLNFLTAEQQLSNKWLGEDGDVVKYMNELAEFLKAHKKLNTQILDFGVYIDNSLLGN